EGVPAAFHPLGVRGGGDLLVGDLHLGGRGPLAGEGRGRGRGGGSRGRVGEGGARRAGAARGNGTGGVGNRRGTGNRRGLLGHGRPPCSLALGSFVYCAGNPPRERIREHHIPASDRARAAKHGGKVPKAIRPHAFRPQVFWVMAASTSFSRSGEMPVLS